MLLFKSCPKCGDGDLRKESDHYGPYLLCVQCGFMRDIPAAVPVPAEPAITFMPEAGGYEVQEAA